MKLSAPIYHLKRRAKTLSREESIPLNEALDRIATKEGYSSWSLLTVRAAQTGVPSELFTQLKPGDMVLLGARPGHGKTRLSLRLLIEAVKLDRRGVFFTLEYNESDILKQFQIMDEKSLIFNDLFEFDNSDVISSDYIMDRLASAPQGTVVVVDYLQLLDQKRENPDLTTQIRALKAFARLKRLIIIFISQIDRSYDLSAKPCPDLGDIRLPNPLDLTLFNKTCFLNDGKIQIETMS